MSDKGVIQTLNEYMIKVFDKNKDGVVTFREFMSVFPSYAVGQAGLL
jgi:Ca2+-binding EF-hand superfamily protein